MKIAFDAKRLFHNHTGLGNYSRNLLYGFETYFPDHEYALLSADINKSSFKDRFSSHSLIYTDGLIPSIDRYLRWHHTINEINPDIYHGLSNELPYFSTQIQAPTIVTIHDLFYMHYPDDFSTIDRSIYKKKTERAVNTADHIVAISEATKNDILKYLDTDESKISVLYQTCNPIFQEDGDKGKQPEGLPSQYMLQVGSINKRKNLSGIIEALGTIKAEHRIPLVIVGNDSGDYATTLKQRIQELNIDKDVFFLGQMDNQSLKSLYKNAMFTSLPSHYEGFGIPIIESLFCGTPVLASTSSSLPEATGPCGYLAHPSDIEDIRNGITSLTDDTEYRNGLIDQIPTHTNKFNLETTTCAMMSLYESMAK